MGLTRWLIFGPCVGTAEENDTFLKGYENPCEFLSVVHYVDNVGNAVNISQLIPLVDSSTSCRQFVQWRCHHAQINDGTRMTFWRNRDGQDMGYWGGASPVPVGRCVFSFLTDRTATQYDRLLASSCPSVRLSVRLSVTLCIVALRVGAQG